MFANSPIIAVIGGDGIGPEVTAVALDVLRPPAPTSKRPTSISAEVATCTTARCSATPPSLSSASTDAILFGAAGRPDVTPGILERGLIVGMRVAFDLYINERPFQGTAPGHDLPHDFVVIRENTEGPYIGDGGFLRKGTLDEVATQGSVNTRMGVERAVRYAFELARRRNGRRHVTMVHKTNILVYAGDLWERTFNLVAADYPDIATAYNHADAACIYFVQDPHRYDVVVTDNLFGDILTDLGGAVSGGIGLAASANLNPARTGPSMFEPVHGSAPDITGQNKANPTAAVLSAAMMMDFLGEQDIADRLRAACEFAGRGSTTEIGDRIAKAVGG